MKHLWSLMKVELILTKRQVLYFLLSVGMPTAFYLIFSGLMSADGAPKTYVRDYMLSMTAFSMMSTALFSLPVSLNTDKITNWQKVLRHSPVSVVEYYISKFLSLVIDYLVSIVVVFAVGHLVRHVDMSLLDWGISALLLIVGSMAFVAIGIALTLLPSMQLTSVISNILYFGLAILGGLWMPITLFPDWVQAISKWMPTYQVMQLLTSYLEKGSFNLTAFLYILVFTGLVLGFSLHIRKRIEVR